MIYEPVVGLILQGSKVTSIGDQREDLRPGEALLVSHDLPVVSRITRTSKPEPYIAVILTFDPGLVPSLNDQVADANLPGFKTPSLSAWQADAAWLAPLIRYFELISNPMDAQVLEPSIRREIHHQLLLLPIGQILRPLLITNGRASLIAREIHALLIYCAPRSDRRAK